MATHEITCATKAHAHRHITNIGGPDGSWTVAEARAEIANGKRFYTVSSTGIEADVERYTCPAPCGVLTLRTDPDSATDNNLDNLPNCA